MIIISWYDMIYWTVKSLQSEKKIQEQNIDITLQSRDYADSQYVIPLSFDRYKYKNKTKNRAK